MSRINTNVTALIGARILNTNNVGLSKSLERLSTGLRINRGSDDPAGLIASENIRKQINGTNTGIKNAERAVNIVSTAEGSLVEVSSMLLDLQNLLGEVANKGGMSQEEIDANQLQVDSILNSINRISNNTEFEGQKLLNGSKAYTTSTPATYSTYVKELNVNSAKLIDGATMKVIVNKTSAADTGHVFLSGSALSATSGMTIQVGSGRGTTELSFAPSTTLTAIAYAINQVKEVTGVSATLSGAVAAHLRSVDFGADAYVSVDVLSGSQATQMKVKPNNTAGTASTSVKDFGVDAVVIVNGATATADGKNLTIRTAMLEAEIDITSAAALTATDWTISFGVTGGGADFAIGSTVEAAAMESIGLPNIAVSQLGNGTDGYLNTIKSGGANSLSSKNLYTAQRIVNAAIKDISTLRGRLGSFQRNTLETTINSLKVGKENLEAAESSIRDTDFATETSQLTRAQILVQSATSVLAQANAAPQNVLSLIRG